MRHLFIMANKHGSKDFFFCNFIKWNFFVSGLPELFYCLKCREPAVLHNKIKILQFCGYIPFSGTRQIEFHISILSGSSCRTKRKPLFQKPEMLNLPCQYILSLMKFLSTNLETYKSSSSVHDTNTRHTLKLHKPSTKLTRYQNVF
jgi:hypothetical protein